MMRQEEDLTDTFQANEQHVQEGELLLRKGTAMEEQPFHEQVFQILRQRWTDPENWEFEILSVILITPEQAIERYPDRFENEWYVKILLEAYDVTYRVRSKKTAPNRREGFITDGNWHEECNLLVRFLPGIHVW